MVFIVLEDLYDKSMLNVRSSLEPIKKKFFPKTWLYLNSFLKSKGIKLYIKSAEIIFFPYSFQVNVTLLPYTYQQS